MLDDWLPLLALVATLPPLYLMQRWINRHLQGLGLLLTGDSDSAVMIYFVALLPGIALHELSHWLVAVLLRVPVGKLSLWPKKKRRGQVRLGSVSVGAADPARASLIGVAPLAVGSLVILLVGQLVLGIGDLGSLLFYGSWGDLWRQLVAYWRVPDFALWLYLIFAIANAMLPSESDRAAWPMMGLYVAGVAGVFVLFGGPSLVTTQTRAAFLAMAGYLAYALGLAAAVSAIFAAVIALVEGVAGRALGRRVEY
jgi:MFS family permease